MLASVVTWVGSPLGAFASALLCLALCGAVSRQRARRLPRAAVWAAVLGALQLTIFSMPAVADAVAWPLEEQARRLAAQPASGERRPAYAAILLLGGSVRGPLYGSDADVELGDAVDRVWHAARLYHAGIAPRILVTGSGQFLDGVPLRPSEAEATRDVLQTLQVPGNAVIIEPLATNTRTNATQSARLLPPDARVALVTSAIHMPRAYREVRNAGLLADAFPTDFQVEPQAPRSLKDWIPNADALTRSTRALKEWLGGLAVRRVAGQR